MSKNFKDPNEQDEYQSPEENPKNSDDSGDSEFISPSTEAIGTEDAEQEMAAYASDFGADVLALKSEIENKLSTNLAAVEAAGLQSEGEGNIVGVGLASVDAEDLVAGHGNGLPGQAGLAVFTVEQVDHSQLQAEVASIAGTSALSEMPITQIPVGIVEAQSHRFRIRPAPGGVSVGHFRITAGTLGCLSVGAHAPRNRRLMVLSNNHVLANSNAARVGDCICQPGAYDGGRCPADQIAILEKFIPIRFGRGFNYVDCATGWAWPQRVRKELIYLSRGRRRFFRIGSSPIGPAPNMLVGKTGRTTQLKQGRITAVNVTVNVNYGSGRVAQFRDQIAIRGLSGAFSAGGDSGSVIWQWASGLRPVGLLFAGGGGTTFGNRITRVLSSLDIRLYT
jgi:hypothetical protein